MIGNFNRGKKFVYPGATKHRIHTTRIVHDGEKLFSDQKYLLQQAFNCQTTEGFDSRVIIHTRKQVKYK